MATILVIDDDEAMIELLKYGLTQAGHKVFSAMDAAGGMTIAAREKPDLITIDFCMPGGDGGKALQRLRGDTFTAATPVIFVSSIAPSIIKTSIPNAANVRYLPKPPDPVRLDALIAELLAAPSPAADPAPIIPPVERAPAGVSATGRAPLSSQPEEGAPPPPREPARSSRLNWKRSLVRPRTLASSAAAAAAALAFVAGAWHFALQPKMRLDRMRYESTLDVARLYGLELRHKKAKGIYAGDLASLLALAPDAAALKANLAANVDLNTLAVVGDARRFKIEINVLDGDRTPIKVTGPNPGRRAAAAPAMREAAPLSADGAPISPLGR